MMKASGSAQLSIGYFSDSEERVIRLCTQTLNPQCTQVRISLLPRFGFSGSKVVVARFDSKAGAPHVVKLNHRSKIAEEYRAAKEVSTYFPDADVRASAFHRGRGALVYPFQGKDERHTPDSIELRDQVFASEVKVERRVRTILSKIYSQNHAHAYAAAHEGEFDWLTEYKRYLRRHRSKNKIAAYSKSSEMIANALELGPVGNPIAVLKRLRHTVKGPRGPIHGDLHASNIILDGHKAPRLIDFAWGKLNRHLLIDFVIMENSIRFMLFPRDVSFQSICQADRQLLSFEGYRNLARHGCSDRDKLRLRQLSSLVGAVREAARESYAGYPIEEHYRIALFLTLYGLAGYDSYDSLRSTLNLGLMCSAF